MKYKDLFIKDLKKEFHITSRNDNSYLHNFIDRINNYENENPNSSYDDFLDYFRTPREIYISYLNQQDDKVKMDTLERNRYIKIITTIVAIFVIALCIWIAYLKYQEHQLIINSTPDEIEITAPEELPSPDEIDFENGN